MNITEEAQEAISKALAENDCNAIRVAVEQSCCGSSIKLDLTTIKEGEQSIMVDGVSVLMDTETVEAMQGVTLTAENGQLAIQNDCGCGCGGCC